MWLHHAPYTLFATVSDRSQGSVRIRIHVYKLTESNETPGIATLNHQEQLTVSSECLQAPRILCFGKLCSDEDALLRPHLIVYDDVLQQLECHCVEVENQSVIAAIGLSLGRVEFCRIVSSTSICIGSKSSRRDRIDGYDLYEWTPSEQRLLQGHLETNCIAGITEAFDNRPWCLFYAHPTDVNRITASQGSSLVGRIQHQQHSPPTIHVAAIPAEYKEKLVRVVVADDTEPTPSFSCVWAQTRSGEMVFFKHGVLQWSTALSSVPVELILAECQAVDSISRICLLALADMNAYLLDATTGRLLKDWTGTKDDTILADIRDVGLCSVLILTGRSQHTTLNCTIYPASPRVLMGLQTAPTDEGVARAKIHMESAHTALEQQLELKQKRIQRLQDSLVSKGDIIQDCQDMMAGPLRSIFNTGGDHSFNDFINREGLVLLQRKRMERQRRVLERLIPIVGNTLTPTLFAQPNNGTSDTEILDAVNLVSPDDPGNLLVTTKSAAGWISPDSVWFGVEVRNQSKETLYNIRLSASQYNMRGSHIPRLRPKNCSLLLGVIQVESSLLADDEYLDRSRTVQRVLSNTVHVLFDHKQSRDEDAGMNSVSFSIPRFPDLAHCFQEWQTPLADILLPSRIGCQLGSIERSRLMLLLQDGLNISCSDDGVTFGSLEEGLMATIEATGQSDDSWDV
ncbi:hypothetical protein BGZ54_000460, partial [Gamsiella multidivaricata]